MERKIGEIFELNHEWYQCIESDSCGECSFFTTECGSGTKSDLADKVAGLCSKVRRIDSKHAIFKKLEKVGGHYKNNDRTYQLYKLPMNLEKLLSHTEGITLVTSDIVEIEIKQKDMEEKKLNLKPFDIQKAREGKPVCTRDGRKARIICFDAKCDNSPIIALIENGKNEEVHKFHKDGKLFGLDEDEESFKDLMMLPEKKEGWVNVYKNQIHDTPKSAEEGHKGITDYIKTIRVEWGD